MAALEKQKKIDMEAVAAEKAADELKEQEMKAKKDALEAKLDKIKAFE